MIFFSKRKKQMTMGWLFGYFIPFAPMTYALNGSLSDGLIWGSIGLVVALLILTTGDKE